MSMVEKIRQNIANPEELERLFRTDRNEFVSAFEKIYPEIRDLDIARFWHVRLGFDREKDEHTGYNLAEIVILISVCVFAGLLIKLPAILNINTSQFLFYEKNAALIVFMGLSIYAVINHGNPGRRNLIILTAAFLVPAIYINLLPSNPASDSINLSYIHFTFLLWFFYGVVWSGFRLPGRDNLFEFIRYNGDLIIMSGLILAAGMVLSGITIGLFNAIGMKIEEFYFRNVGFIGVVSIPVIATFIIRKHPSLTNKIAPIIANIFSPLVLLSAIVYLVAFIFSGKNPFTDREFLLTFNLMLTGVMGIIIFSSAETSVSRKQRFNEMILLFLSCITIIIDLIALSAIFFRLGEYGITPNRIAILAFNVLVLGNLVLFSIELFRINFRGQSISRVESVIARYLPVYLVWAAIVVFAFPFIFGMR